MAKIKVGVFGAFRGNTMINVMARHPDAELVAICDKYQPALDKCKLLEAQTGSKITYYTDFDKFFEHDMDAVVLANYATEHAPYAIRLLNSGRHVTSEVLPVQTLGQAVELCEAVEKSGKIYTYSENYCYFHSTSEIRRLYKKGDLGELVHAEGEYVHDMERIWADKTYGDPNHWRNRMYSSYYCTHALGPILHITGLRPKTIVGFETPNTKRYADLGFKGGTSAMILMQLENGATVKVLDGKLQREPYPVWYCLYGTEGSVETDRWDNSVQRIYRYDPKDEKTSVAYNYKPKPSINNELSKLTKGHGGSDYYTMHYFLEKILGREEEPGACIDVYEALDMAVPGILAYRSALSGNSPLAMPDFRDKAAREAFRGDNACTDPAVAGDQLLPQCSHGVPDIPDSVYAAVREKWLKAEQERKGL